MLNHNNNFNFSEFQKMFDFLSTKYEMTYEEKKAYKICLYWYDALKKLFPEHNHGKIAKGDPRKSHVFKYCFKLMRETLGDLHEDDYKLYVYAQLDILRRININKNEKPLININCLTGVKAWKRWKLWKSRYDLLNKQRKITSRNKSISISNEKVIHALKNTLIFLNKNINENYTFNEYKNKLENGDIKRWILLKKISPYYLILSNFFYQVKGHNSIANLNLELDIYQVSINKEIRDIFSVMFKNEI